MAKIRQTDEQQDGLRYISNTLKDLDRLKVLMKSDIELNAKGTIAGKVSFVKIDIAKAKITKLIKDYGQTLAASVEARAARLNIELEDEEIALCSFFKSGKTAEKKEAPEQNEEREATVKEPTVVTESTEAAQTEQ